jgi:iron complex outermembrane recepter protein
MNHRFFVRSSVLALIAGAGATTAFAETTAVGATETTAIEEVIVTAQKRSEAINEVPLSISAASGEALQRQGVTDVAGLVKVVPGFNAIDSGYGTPVYFLRGIGFFDSSVAAKPTVSVYLDQAPLPFTLLATGVSFDLERVEVLKGPQGTLFGQNATGGAINYIAAKPTDAFEAGLRGSLGRFTRTEVEAFVSGPLSDTVGARLAVRHEGGDDWQRSYTRDDGLGRRDLLQGRAILAWTPSTSLSASLTLAGYLDRSDTQAAQFQAPFQQTTGGFFDPRLIVYPRAPAENRAADWGHTVPLKRDNKQGLANLRVDYELSDNLTLTSLTSYVRFKEAYGQDGDGTALILTDLFITGKIRSFTQELRLAGDFGGRGSWILGANYEDSHTDELVRQFLTDQTSAHAFDRLGLPPIQEVPQESISDYTSKAVFADASFPVTETLTLSAGARYTETDFDTQACIYNAGNGTYGRGLEALLRLPAGSIPIGTCATLGADRRPTRFNGSLPEDNFSWRLNAKWEPSAGRMIYASVSRGFKSGSFANLAASEVTQYRPVVQEQVTAYEIGTKLSLAERTVQLNGALFYYDYEDKQLKGRTIVPIFGPLESLVNVPRSRVKGGEVQLQWAPIAGLRISAGATYLDTEVTKSFSNYTAFGQVADFKGSRFPYTSKWQANADVEYAWSLDGGLRPFVGASLTYRSATNGDFIPDARLAIDAYTLLDLTAGVEAPDGAWRASVFGRNVTGEYYWQTAVRRGDAIVRYAGQPTTYGVTFAYRWR